VDLRLVEVAQMTHTGRVRDHNEDRLLAAPPLLAVADGMGGAKAGEVAAQMTVDRLADTGPAPSAGLVLQAIADANREVRELSESDPDHAGMGTTVTAALVGERAVRIMHVGDSRGYLIRAGEMRQVTDDHSLVAEMMRQGTLTPEDAERHPSRNIITRVIGAEPDVAVDEVEVALAPGDVLLLCSDGLSSMVPADRIRTLATSNGTLRERAARLVNAALDAGGSDNVTVVMGRVEDVARSADGERTTEHTAEFPPVTDGEPTVEGVPPAPQAQPKPQTRTAAVLEPTDPARRSTTLRRVGMVSALVLAVLVALGAWVGTRSYFVDARGDHDTVRVYHGPPFGIGGLDLFGDWGDTHVPAAAVREAAPNLLSSSVHGQGESVRRAVAIVWRYGLAAVPTVTPPPDPPPAPPPAPNRPAAPAR